MDEMNSLVLKHFENGVVLERVSEYTLSNFSSRGNCPICHASLRVFNSGWKPQMFVRTSGEDVGKILVLDGMIRCPICETYLDRNFCASVGNDLAPFNYTNGVLP